MSKVNQCPSDKSGYERLGEVRFAAEFTEEFLGALGVGDGVCSDNKDYYVKGPVKKDLIEKAQNFLKSAYRSYLDVSNKNVLEIDDLYWLNPGVSKGDIDRYLDNPPPLLDEQNYDPEDWGLIAEPMGDRLVAQIRAASNGGEGIFKRSLRPGAYYVSAGDLEELKRISDRLYSIAVAMEVAGCSEKYIKKIEDTAYEFKRHAVSKETGGEISLTGLFILCFLGFGVLTLFGHALGEAILKGIRDRFWPGGGQGGAGSGKQPSSEGREVGPKDSNNAFRKSVPSNAHPWLPDAHEFVSPESVFCTAATYGVIRLYIMKGAGGAMRGLRPALQRLGFAGVLSSFAVAIGGMLLLSAPDALSKPRDIGNPNMKGRFVIRDEYIEETRSLGSVFSETVCSVFFGCGELE